LHLQNKPPTNKRFSDRRLRSGTVIFAYRLVVCRKTDHIDDDGCSSPTPACLEHARQLPPESPDQPARVLAPTTRGVRRARAARGARAAISAISPASHPMGLIARVLAAGAGARPCRVSTDDHRASVAGRASGALHAVGRVCAAVDAVMGGRRPLTLSARCGRGHTPSTCGRWGSASQQHRDRGAKQGAPALRG